MYSILCNRTVEEEWRQDLSFINRGEAQENTRENIVIMTVDVHSRQLFGGAITASIPQDWLDASDLRQIPDNQEVFLSARNDLTLIVEVLQKVNEGAANEDFEAAVRFHFDSLAHDNEASSSNVEQIFALPGTSPSATMTSTVGTPAPLLLVGEQRIKKFGQGTGAGDRVRIYLALWRLSPAKNVDLVMSLNMPVSANEDVGGAEQSAAVQGSASADAHKVFGDAAASLVIRDWNLFA